jgi:hypothetical protein
MDFLPGVRLERPTPDENPTGHAFGLREHWDGLHQLVWPGVWPDPMNPFKGMV